jgi:hypothetical protein
MRSRRLVPLLIAVALVAMLPSPASAAWSSTKIEDWGSDPDAVFRTDIEETSVVYVRRNPNPDAIRFATLDSGVWFRQTVVSGNVFFGDADPQLAFDGSGRPWVFFEQILPDGSQLYVRDNGVWEQAIFLDGESAQDLQVFSDGTVALLSRTGGQGPLNYSLYDPNSDTIVEDTEIASQDGTHSALNLTDEDVARIVFDEIDGQVRYAQQTQAGWDIELISGLSGSSERPSLTFKGEQARVAYVNNSGLMYAFRADDDLWSRRLVHGNASATNPVIRTAQNGLPQIAYETGVGPFNVRWAVHTGSGWKHALAFSNVGGPGLGGLTLVGSPSGTPRLGYNGTSTVRWGQMV